MTPKDFDFSDIPRAIDPEKLAGLELEVQAPTEAELKDLIERVLRVSSKPRDTFPISRETFYRMTAIDPDPYRWWPTSELARWPWLRRALPKALFRA